MTIASMFSSLLRPCGADLAPPKSPLTDGSSIKRTKSSNQTKQQTNHLSDRDPNPEVLHPWDADKATPQGSSSTDKSTPVLVEKKTEMGSGTPRKGGPPACEASEELVRVFGFEILHQLHSKAWDDRVQALNAVSERVNAPDTGAFSAEDLFAASAVAVQAALSDRVMPVYMAALELSRVLIVDYVARHDIPAAAVLTRADAMAPVIVAKTSDRNQRTVEATHSTLMAMARVPCLSSRCIAAPALVAVSAKETATIRGRLNLLEVLIEEFGISKNSGLSLSAVMSWVRPHLEAPDAEVRQGAIDVTVACYSAKGERTCQYVANLKPALLKLLETRFAETTTSKGKSKTKTRGSRARRLPALKGQHGQGLRGMPPSRASSRHSTSSSSSGGRQSSSAGSTDSRVNPLVTPSRPRAASRASDLSMRSPGEDLLLGSRLDPLISTTFDPPSMHGGASLEDAEAQYMDRTGSPIRTQGPVCDYERDLYNLEADIAAADEAFMKDIEGLY